MTWNDIAIDPELVRACEPTIFGQWTDTEIQSPRLAVIRDEVRLDIADAIGSTTTIADATLDVVAATWTSDVVRAFVYKFLHLHFVDHDGGDGSATRYRAKMYGDKYQTARAQFRRFAGDTASVRQTTLSR
jgi:hypothetical protein